MKRILFTIAIASLFAVQVLAQFLPTPKPSSLDGSSYGNIEEVATEHLALDFSVDFEKRQFRGQVDHYMRVHRDGVKTAVLDYVGIDIDEVALQSLPGGEEKEAKYKMFTNLNKNLGNALEVALPEDMQLTAGSLFKLRVIYNTNNETTAISWLTAEQTAGKKMPYLFTQCETIACRSVAPMQDSPANKVTYEAKVTVDPQFVVKMSANQTKVETGLEDNKTAYYFENQIKMPSYLIAIAVGDLEYKSLGRRVGVITEPSQMAAVSSELETLETLLDSAEKYLTPYIWGNYSILILPPSFPFGGMENPLLTFASPTIITGDKSQVYVATHEIAHSWTGNDVTCQNWEHFWLNEGFTVFEERKVSSRLHGAEFAQVEALLGNTSMYAAMTAYGMDNVFSSLHPTLKGAAPDDSFSTVPYEKGFQLLYYLESLVGEDLFQEFIRRYILAHQQTSVTTTAARSTWENFVEDMFNATETNRILASVDWDTWIYKPGPPPVQLDFTTKASNESAQLADDYIKLGGKSSPENSKDFDGWYSNLKVVFLDRLLARQDAVTPAMLALIDKDYQLTATVDPELKQRWFPLAIQGGYATAMEPAHTFVCAQGRLKYLTPIYTALLASNQRPLAVKWFNENLGFYHPMAVASLKKLLNIQEEPATLVQVVKSHLKDAEFLQ